MEHVSPIHDALTLIIKTIRDPKRQNATKVWSRPHGSHRSTELDL